MVSRNGEEWKDKLLAISVEESLRGLYRVRARDARGTSKQFD
jgi:hypothetical protein